MTWRNDMAQQQKKQTPSVGVHQNQKEPETQTQQKEQYAKHGDVA